MEQADHNPEVGTTSNFMRPDAHPTTTEPHLRLVENIPVPEPSSLRLFRFAMEDEPELMLFAIGRALTGQRHNETRPPIGELGKACEHVDGAVRFGILNLIAGADVSTETSLASDGDYQLVVATHGTESTPAKLRLLRTYLIRVLLEKNSVPDDPTEAGHEAA